MGCGDSKTRECESRKKTKAEELAKLKLAYKTLVANSEIVSKEIEGADEAVKRCENEDELDNGIKEAKKAYPNLKLSEAEIKEALFYLSGINLIESVKSETPSSLITDLCSRKTMIKNEQTIEDETIQNFGKELDAISLEIKTRLEDPYFYLKGTLNILKCDDAYKKNSEFFILTTAFLSNEKAISDLGDVIEMNYNLQNLVIAVDLSDAVGSKVDIKNLSALCKNVGYNRSILNFAVIIVTNDPKLFNNDPDAIKDICSAFERHNLKGFALVNFPISTEECKILGGFIQKQQTLTMLAIQPIVYCNEYADELVKHIGCSQSLKIVLLGADNPMDDDKAEGWVAEMKKAPNMKEAAFDKFEK